MLYFTITMKCILKSLQSFLFIIKIMRISNHRTEVINRESSHLFMNLLWNFFSDESTCNPFVLTTNSCEKLVLQDCKLLLLLENAKSILKQKKFALEKSFLLFFSTVFMTFYLHGWCPAQNRRARIKNVSQIIKTKERTDLLPTFSVSMIVLVWKNKDESGIMSFRLTCC